MDKRRAGDYYSLRAIIVALAQRVQHCFGSGSCKFHVAPGPRYRSRSSAGLPLFNHAEYSAGTKKPISDRMRRFALSVGVIHEVARQNNRPITLDKRSTT